MPDLTREEVARRLEEPNFFIAGHEFEALSAIERSALETALALYERLALADALAAAVETDADHPWDCNTCPGGPPNGCPAECPTVSVSAALAAYREGLE